MPLLSGTGIGLSIRVRHGFDGSRSNLQTVSSCHNLDPSRFPRDAANDHQAKTVERFAVV
jgi:hypothetical protein